MLLSNYREHPEKTNYLIFTYTQVDMANYFSTLLKEKNIAYEIDESAHGDGILILFAVKTTHREEAVRCNFLAYGKYRKPLIANKILRYSILVFFFLLIFIACIGYLKSK